MALTITTPTYRAYLRDMLTRIAAARVAPNQFALKPAMTPFVMFKQTQSRFDGANLTPIVVMDYVWAPAPAVDQYDDAMWDEFEAAANQLTLEVWPPDQPGNARGFLDGVDLIEDDYSQSRQGGQRFYIARYQFRDSCGLLVYD